MTEEFKFTRNQKRFAIFYVTIASLEMFRRSYTDSKTRLIYNRSDRFRKPDINAAWDGCYQHFGFNLVASNL